MQWYAIVETDVGLTVAEIKPGSSAEEAAVQYRGVVVDAGPYKTYSDAYDALLAMQNDDEE